MGRECGIDSMKMSAGRDGKMDLKVAKFNLRMKLAASRWSPFSYKYKILCKAILGLESGNVMAEVKFWEDNSS